MYTDKLHTAVCNRLIRYDNCDMLKLFLIQGQYGPNISHVRKLNIQQLLLESTIK